MSDLTPELDIQRQKYSSEPDVLERLKSWYAVAPFPDVADAIAEIERLEKEVLGLHMAFNQAKRVIDEMAQGDKVVRRIMDEVVELRAQLLAITEGSESGWVTRTWWRGLRSG